MDDRTTGRRRSMTPAEFSVLLSRRKLPSVLLFDGEDQHQKHAALADLRRALLPEGLEDLNETMLEDPDPDTLIAAAETLPFMADRRLIVVRDDPALVGRKEPEDRLLSYLPQAPASSVILYFCVQNVDRKKKLFKAIEKLGGEVNFEPLKGAALTSFVVRAFHDLGRECPERTADLLIFTSGSDTGVLLSEAAKIAAFHPENPTVLPEDIEALATPSVENRIFRLTDAVCAGQADRALSLLRNLQLNGERPEGITGILLRQFRLLQHVKIMQYEKRSTGDIQTALGLKNSYALQSFLRQAGAFSGRQVKEAVLLCLDTDLKAKSGQLNGKTALDALVLKLLLLREDGKT